VRVSMTPSGHIASVGRLWPRYGKPELDGGALLEFQPVLASALFKLDVSRAIFVESYLFGGLAGIHT
jgi:hypothetical protein